MNTKKITFENNQGTELTASLDLPFDQKPIAYAIFAHCFTCTRNIAAIKNITQAMTRNGIAVLRFDFTGLQKKEDDLNSTDFSSNVQDLITAAEILEKDFEAPKMIIGHSFGGAAAIFAGNQIKSMQAIATIGAPASPDLVSHLFKDSTENNVGIQVVDIHIGGRNFKVRKQFLDDFSKQQMNEKLKSLKKPLLILHSPQDKVVSIDNASEIYRHAMHPKSFISLDGADHLLTNKKDSDYVGDVVSSWAKRYLNLKDEDQLITDNQVAVQIGREKYTTEIIAGNHGFRADEPSSHGGFDYGPSPYDLLLASLGSCTAMTLRMYADIKKWDVDKITVHLDHKKTYAEDCIDCESKKAKIDHMSRHIEIDGNIDDKQRNRMLEIANKCPVHKTLHNDVVITTELK